MAWGKRTCEEGKAILSSTFRFKVREFKSGVVGQCTKLDRGGSERDDSCTFAPSIVRATVVIGFSRSLSQVQRMNEAIW